MDRHQHKTATSNGVALIALGLALWLFGGLFAAYGPDGSPFGLVLGLTGVVAVVVGVVIRLRA